MLKIKTGVHNYIKMGNQLAITIICFIIMALLISLALLDFYLNIIQWIAAWFCSSKEDKAGLIRLKGHYNANGYLVHSDSDIQLADCTNGNFRRFESVDQDLKVTVATTNLSNSDNDQDRQMIPPQPLRPAPVPETSISQCTMETKITGKEITHQLRPIEKTSISPIPRPTFSINVATLQLKSSFPVNLTPPPSPTTHTAGVSRAQNAPLKLSAVQRQSSCGQQNGSVGQETEKALVTAFSCDNVCSDTSVALGDPEELNVTGYLCIALEFDSECCDLVVNVLEAKNLSRIWRTRDGFMSSYIRVSLPPDNEATIQTKIYRSSSSPCYKERFVFSLNPCEQYQRVLNFHLYVTDFLSHTLVGEGEIRLSDVSLRQPVTTWITLTNTGQRGTEFGELFFSLCYLPTAERLTVVVVKARNLKFHVKNPSEVLVKVYLMQENKKINKKKTSAQRAERSVIFNEAMIFYVPVHSLSTIQLRLTVSEMINDDLVKDAPIGHVIISAQASGRSYSHWNQMLTTLRKPVALWHPLLK